MKHFFQITIILSCISCNITDETKYAKTAACVMALSNYNLNQPDEVCEMPWELREISGIDKIDETHFACIEDEHGIIYIYDLERKAIIKEIRFSAKGDFEDVAVDGDTAYILRSDEMIFRIDNYNISFVTSVINTSLNSKANTEGLCLDKLNHRLLIACKGNAPAREIPKHDKAVYTYDLVTHTFADKPVLVINQKEIEKELNAKIYFAPAAIATHPITGDIYVIGTVGKLLLVFSQNGQLRNIQRLEGKYFVLKESVSLLMETYTYRMKAERVKETFYSLNHCQKIKSLRQPV